MRINRKYNEEGKWETGNTGSGGVIASLPPIYLVYDDVRSRAYTRYNEGGEMGDWEYR